MSSYKIFHDSHLINNLDWLQRVIRGNNLKEWHRAMLSIRLPILDIIKIYICFENFLKVELLLKGYVIHKIDTRVSNRKYKKLYNEQKSRPIKISEIKAVEGLRWEKGNNYHFESLTKQTILFKTVISKPKYISVFSFHSKIFRILENIHAKRNTSHFLLDTHFSYSTIIDDYKYLSDVVNSRLKRRHNSICKFLGFEDILLP